MSAHNPLHSTRSQIYMLAVLRYSDKTVVAIYTNSREVSVEGVRECVAGNAQMTPGRRYTSQGDTQAIHYSTDAQGRVYAIVTNPNYSVRVAFSALDELQNDFAAYGSRIAASGEGGLSKPAQQTLKAIADKYANPAQADKLVSVQEKLDVVKTVMKDNIQQILLNEEKIEKIDAAAVQLNEQSAAFKTNSKALTNKMFWKMWKMRILIGGLIIAVLLIIIVPIAVTNSQSSSSGK